MLKKLFTYFTIACVFYDSSYFAKVDSMESLQNNDSNKNELEQSNNDCADECQNYSSDLKSLLEKHHEYFSELFCRKKKNGDVCYDRETNDENFYYWKTYDNDEDEMYDDNDEDEMYDCHYGNNRSNILPKFCDNLTNYYDLFTEFRYKHLDKCSNKHYKVCADNNFHCIEKQIGNGQLGLWHGWLHHNYASEFKNDNKCINEDYDAYDIDTAASYEKNKKDLLKVWLIKYFKYYNDNENCMLYNDPIHKVMISTLCNAKILDEDEIKYFFGSKNFYEAFIVLAIQLKILQQPLDKLLFDKHKIAYFNFDERACWDIECDYGGCSANKFLGMMGNTYYKNSGKFFKDFIDKMPENKKLSNREKLDNIPLMISELNNISYIQNNKICFDYNRFGNVSVSNLEKVLKLFDFCKLKFNFKLDKKELSILSPKEDSIPEFFDFIFELVKKTPEENDEKNDEENDGEINPYGWCDKNNVLYRWCIETIKTLVDSVEDLSTCKLFKYIDKTIRCKDNFLQNLLDLSMYYLNDDNKTKYNKNDLLKLKKALLEYYSNSSDKLSEEKFNILEKFDINHEVINSDFNKNDEENIINAINHNNVFDIEIISNKIKENLKFLDKLKSGIEDKERYTNLLFALLDYYNNKNMEDKQNTTIINEIQKEIFTAIE